MFNFYEIILDKPYQYKQISCKESLFTLFNCPLENKFEDAWSHQNYFIYVMEGRKIWHTAHGSYDLRKGNCVFVRKGACVVEQFFDSGFCLLMFFVSDDFICDVLKSKTGALNREIRNFEPLIAVDMTMTLQAFFHSMLPYFDSVEKPDNLLLELKFRELILILADNPQNSELLSYFCALLKEPQSASLQRIMDENFCFNLKLEQYAKLSNRSLSAFKRDFQKQFNTTPGKWLMEKRLNHAMNLLANSGKTVSETAFDSGFESPSHFSRAFRQRFGMAPASIRK